MVHGDEMTARGRALLVRPDNATSVLGWFLRYAAGDASLPTRVIRLLSFLREAKPAMREIAATHCEVAEMMARRLGFPESVQRTVRYTTEQWDGKGLAYGIKSAETPVSSRIVHMAEVMEVAHGFGGAAKAADEARERAGTEFDPDLAAAFVQVSEQPGFWREIDQDSVQSTVLQMRPLTEFDRASDDDIGVMCDVLADFADLSARHDWNHSLLVAETAAGIGSQMGLNGDEVTTLTRSALVHDLGKAAVPSVVLQKRDNLSEIEWEAFRLHPYYTERILSRVSSLRPLANVAGAHHERLAGDGYHKRLSGDQIPTGGRILAVADEYARLYKRTEEPDSQRALDDIGRLSGSGLDSTVCEALATSLSGASPAPKRRRAQNPGYLTEREVEVLRQLATGSGNRQIARDLVISEKTVEHHLDHIYTKLDVSSRTSAVVFAVQNGLVG